MGHVLKKGGERSGKKKKISPAFHKQKRHDKKLINSTGFTVRGKQVGERSGHQGKEGGAMAANQQIVTKSGKRLLSKDLKNLTFEREKSVGSGKVK